MSSDGAIRDSDREVRQAVIGWGIFLLLAILLNGTIPFALGVDMRGWTGSFAKRLIFDAGLYAGYFLVVPLILTKGWATVRQLGFAGPLLIAVLGISLRHFFPFAPAVVPVVIAYLHWRYDLSSLGIRSLGWRGDVAAVALMALLGLGAALLPPHPIALAPINGLSTAANRMFANPASTVENLFYFGYLAERLSHRTGRWLTPILIGAMYTLHELTNPEYWYSGMSFGFVFVGLTIVAALYLWRRSVPIVWLGDGLLRFMRGMSG